VSKLTDLTKLIARGPDPERAHDPDAVRFGEDAPDINATLQRDLRRPIMLGGIIVLVLVVGLMLWAAFARVSGAVLASGTVRVENNSKQIGHLESGIVRRILVREGQRVRRGQLLIEFDAVQPQAMVRVFQAAADSAHAQAARFQAEQANASDIRFPEDLLRRQNDPQVALLIAGQRNLFASRMMLYRNQASVLAAQIQQIETQISGLRAQMVSVDSQSELINSELEGVRELNQQGYAPRSRLLALQRNAAALKGQRGSLISEIARAQETIGETRIQLAQLNDKRQTEAAEGLRTAQGQLTEIEPKLGATQASLAQTEVRAPVDGYVFNLTQFTEGGVAGAGERLMQIVPVNSRLLITARVRPQDISDVKTGMKARVTLTAYNPRTTPVLDGQVTLVSADATVEERTGEAYYVVQIRVEPSELARAGPGVRLSPGMPAQVAIVTRDRTILDYLLGPLTESMQTSLRER
jgi:HlyD family type I secretion membrane fusion protein